MLVGWRRKINVHLFFEVCIQEGRLHIQSVDVMVLGRTCAEDGPESSRAECWGKHLVEVDALALAMSSYDESGLVSDRVAAGVVLEFEDELGPKHLAG